MVGERVPRERTQARAVELVSFEDLQRLAASWRVNRRVRVEIVGRSHEGRDIYSIVVSDPANLEVLDQVRQASRQMTTPVVKHRTVNDVDVHFEGTIPQEPTTVVYVEGGGFGMEAAHVEGLVQLIERLIASRDRETAEILRKNVIVIMPMINPDGRMLAIEEWKRTPLSGGSAGHGNRYGFTLNRDLFNLTQPESRAIASANWDWGLVAVYDPHEDMALLGVSHEEVCWCPPWNDKPYPPEHNTKIMELVDEMGAAIAEEWRGSGFKCLYDPIGHSGLLSFIMGPLTGRVDMSMIQHGIPAVLTESARTPGTQLWEDRVRQKSDAAMAIVKKVTREQKRFIDAVRTARSEIPKTHQNAAYVIPDCQPDRGVLNEFLRILIRHELAVYHVTSPYPAYVVPQRQPRVGVVRTLFSDGSLDSEVLCPDYGIAVYDLAVRPKQEQEAFAAQPLGRVTSPLETGIHVCGEGKGTLAFANSYSGIVLANRLLKARCPVVRLGHIEEGSAGFSGSRHFAIESGTFRLAQTLAGQLDLELLHVENSQRCEAKPIDLPRVGVYVGEGIGHLNMEHLADVLWSLDVLEFPFVRIDRLSLLEGALETVDVLIVPGGDGKAIIGGLDPDIPWHKTPGEPPVPTGRGIGAKGVGLVQEFVRAGGRYLGIGMGGGWFATKDLAGLMDVSTAPAPLGSGIVYLNAEPTPHCLLSGYVGMTRRDGKQLRERMAGYFYAPPFYFKEAGTSPLFVPGRDSRAVATYEQSLAPESRSEDAQRTYVGKGAIVTQAVGSGTATIVGVNVGFRAAWFSTYPFLANVIYGQPNPA
jgi:glutamine amidotransferase-like uncharacterized protein